MPDKEPQCVHPAAKSIELAIDGRPRDLGDGFTVRRVLPSIDRRHVGPFVFLDHMGPTVLAPGKGLDVRPHPHVCLATLTYLFEGEIVHRDSLGSLQTIRAGDVNWMIAGRGIAHSERTPPEARAAGPSVHGLQCWCALPLADEEMPPAFEHHDASTVPAIDREGVKLRVVAGTVFGKSSPVGVRSPTLYVEARLDDGAELPLPDDHPERAVYVVDGAIASDDRMTREGSMIVFRSGIAAKIRADGGPAHVMVIGGAPLEGERFLWWNFVASKKERLERAKRDWREGKFGKVVGDEGEEIPLPER
jgi:redox-sensitive bicupin YhaK (pirin superfamily)